jgi:hypothetical protein
MLLTVTEGFGQVPPPPLNVVVPDPPAGGGPINRGGRGWLGRKITAKVIAMMMTAAMTTNAAA